MPLKINQHIGVELILKKRLDVLQRQNHLLVQLDGDLQCHRVNYAHERRVARLVEAQIIVGQVYCLHHSLIEALGLHRKLKYGENSFFPHVLLDRALIIFGQEVDRVILQIDSTAGASPRFFCKNIIQVVNKLLLAAELLDRIVYREAVLVHLTDLGSALLEHAPNFEN